MLTREEIESLNFTWYRFSPKSLTNDEDDRNDYVAAIQRGRILIIIVLRHYANGYIRLNNHFANPMKNTFHYYMGQANTLVEFETELDVLDFKPLKVSVEFIED
jgi:hypothetical protein